MVKIAVCISGHMRSYKHSKDRFDIFIDYLKSYGNVDVFVATWDKQNTGNSWIANKGISRIRIGGNSHENDDTKITQNEIKLHYGAKEVKVYSDDFYSSMYGPLHFDKITNRSFEIPDHMNPTLHGGAQMHHNKVLHSSKMFFLHWKANQLKCEEEYINLQRYDIVFRVRPDYFFQMEQFNFQEVEDDIYYCARYKHPEPEGRYFDQFWYSTSETGDMVAAVFLSLGSIIEKHGFSDPEKLLGAHCLSKNIKLHHTKPWGVLYFENIDGSPANPR